MKILAPVPSRNSKPSSHEGGFSLLEVLISVLLFSVGLLALIGMQGMVIGHTMDAEYRLQASYLTNQVVGRMWVDQTNLSTYDTDTSPPGGHFLEGWFLDVASSLPGASGANEPTIDVNGTQVEIVVRWQRPGEGQTRTLRTTTFINGPT